MKEDEDDIEDEDVDIELIIERKESEQDPSLGKMDYQFRDDEKKELHKK